MNNKLNNRNIFSVKLFWQSFLQLKIIGIISTAIMICITRSEEHRSRGSPYAFL